MNPLVYDLAAGTLRVIFRTLFRARVYGIENVPREGALIVACNHVSYLDPPGLCFCPRRISFMAKKELFEIPVLGPVIRAVGTYPVDRQGSARAAIKRSLAVLDDGGAVGIFPEGTRNLTGDDRAPDRRRAAGGVVRRPGPSRMRRRRRSGEPFRSD